MIYFLFLAFVAHKAFVYGADISGLPSDMFQKGVCSCQDNDNLICITSCKKAEIPETYCLHKAVFDWAFGAGLAYPSGIKDGKAVKTNCKCVGSYKPTLATMALYSKPFSVYDCTGWITKSCTNNDNKQAGCSGRSTATCSTNEKPTSSLTSSSKFGFICSGDGRYFFKVNEFSQEWQSQIPLECIISGENIVPNSNYCEASPGSQAKLVLSMVGKAQGQQGLETTKMGFCKLDY